MSVYLARSVGTPKTFTAAGIFCATLALAAALVGAGGHRPHRVQAPA